MSLFRRHQKTIIWILIIGFVASIAVGGGVGIYLRSRSSPARGSPEEVVLTVDGRKVTRQEYAQAYQDLRESYKQLYARFGLDFDALLQGTDGAWRALPYRAQAAEEIVRSVLLQAAARELRVVVAKAEVDKATATQYQNLLRQYGLTEAELAEALRAQGRTLEAFKKELAQAQEAQLRAEAVRKAVVGPVEPTEADLAAYYAANRERYQTEPEKIRVAHILVKEARLADELLGKIAAGADFAALARTHSRDEKTKDKGGETDWFSKAESPFSAKVTEAVWPAEVGQVKLVDDDEGFHLVKVLERKAAVVPPLAEVRDKVKADYVREEEGKRWDAWYSARRGKAKVAALDPVLAAAMAYGTDKAKALAELE
ncbi:MAG: SurA N-terminal domain-containing protein, partial [Candidatus Bipolaricaulota bacterium]|nr:SurA N-terminal domain-containing protein [Candidatus Bipolaricaulota bacterium]